MLAGEVGKGIDMPQIETPSAEDVDKWHKAELCFHCFRCYDA